MDMSWQTTFALACAAVFAAVVPGTLGYTTARLETADRQRAELARLRVEVQASQQTVQRLSESCAPGENTSLGSPSAPPSRSGSSGSSGSSDSPDGEHLP
ncbi:hypothetical protein [Sphaerisporangium album]|uniref:hypothetical protein n=1 Tax=Sphaerisporangium album TaxID=509200 RepID=UPI0011C02F39|nr:hypothetical protein [Sphaerisporangium album]